MAPAMFADVTDYLLNVNGASYCPLFTQVGGCPNTGLAGAGASGSLDTSPGGTGLGTVTLTYNPGAAGTYNVDFWLFEQLSVPGWNEYGSQGGTAVAGQSRQIDVPDYNYFAGIGGDPNFGFLPTGAGTIVAHTQGDTLLNKNFVPGQTDTYGLNCVGLPTCN